MKADKVLLQSKYFSVIKTLAETANVPLREALDMFYRSQVYLEMRDGISDMHCRSDKYLAEDLLQEYGINPSAEKIDVDSTGKISGLF
jgi:hypothetical protein